MKTTNFLLNGRLEAKIGDFGPSKIFLPEGLTHVSTAVKATSGNLDPEYVLVKSPHKILKLLLAESTVLKMYLLHYFKKIH